MDQEAGLGTHGAIFTKEDRRNFDIWRAQIFEHAVIQTEEPSVPRALSSYSVMCELNQQQLKERKFDELSRRCDLYTLYKSATKKVRPVDIPRQGHSAGFGRED